LSLKKPTAENRLVLAQRSAKAVGVNARSSFSVISFTWGSNGELDTEN
jgi:hypothetical protein